MIPAKQAHLHPAALTHPGMTGKNNEDQYAISAYKLSEEDPTPVVLGIVADGIGGHNAGEVASEIAVNTISSIIAESDGSDPLGVLEKGFQEASARIQAQSQRETGQQGMGSTCVCTLIIGEKLYIASMGDSRIYLLRDGNFRQLTTDHSWIQKALDHGVISPEEALDHPRRNIIHRYLGSAKSIEVDTRLRLKEGESDQESEANQGMRLLPGDELLLCSDGLTDLVADEDILNIMQEDLNQKETLEKLVDLANKNGGYDNITAITLLVPDDFPEKKVLQTKRDFSKALWFPTLSLALILIINILGLIVWILTR